MTIGEFTIEQKIAELDREIKLRHRVYPRMVQRGQLTRETAQHRIAVLSSVLRDCQEKAKEGPLFNHGGK